MQYLLLLFASCFALCASDHPWANDIAVGFSTWSPKAQPKTALCYAEHLASQSDQTSKKWAQAIIFHGAGFDGFVKNATANDPEIGQYFNVVHLLRGRIPDDSYQGLPENAYHRGVLYLLVRYAAGLIQDVSAIQKTSLGVKDSFYWLGIYGAHHNPHLRNMGEELAAFRIFRTKSPCVYSGCFDAAPHVHPYGTEESENTFPHYTFVKEKANEKTFVVISEPLVSWQGKPVLLRPHAYIGHCVGIGKGGGWVQNVQASVMWNDGGAPHDISGSVHIHDNLASPAGVMVLGNYEEVAAKGPFVTRISSHAPVKTLHILLPYQQQGLSLGGLSTMELLGYVAFVCPEFSQQKFILDHLGA